jgi:hypothetical protein
MIIDMLSLLLLIFWLPAAIWAERIVHDDQFKPDHVLRISIGRVSSACETREDVVVNGSSPGPVIRIPPGERTWIRVYNDMPDRNATIVSQPASSYYHPRTD